MLHARSEVIKYCQTQVLLYLLKVPPALKNTLGRTEVGRVRSGSQMYKLILFVRGLGEGFSKKTRLVRVKKDAHQYVNPSKK